MSIISTAPKRGCKDVFHAFLVKNANYDGYEEIPKIRTSHLLPTQVISFSKAIAIHKYDRWIHFYENDCNFERLWNNPKQYISLIKRFQGVISPDFSLYYDMPYVMQLWNTYRGKAIANWLNENRIDIIPNVRWGDERTFELSTLGVEKGKTIAVGTHGCIKTIEGKKKFIEGFDYAISKLQPKNVIVYGRMPDKIFCLAKMYGINLIAFESEFSKTHKKEGC